MWWLKVSYKYRHEMCVIYGAFKSCFIRRVYIFAKWLSGVGWYYWTQLNNAVPFYFVDVHYYRFN